MMATASPVLAQRVEVEPLQSAAIPRWVIMVLAAGFVVLAIIPSFKSSKRSHQD